MEECEMGRYPVSLGGIMRSAQLLEPGEIARCDLGSDNQRAGH